MIHHASVGILICRILTEIISARVIHLMSSHFDPCKSGRLPARNVVEQTGRPFCPATCKTDQAGDTATQETYPLNENTAIRRRLPFFYWFLALIVVSINLFDFVDE
jgi:hypothetical protein